MHSRKSLFVDTFGTGASLCDLKIQVHTGEMPLKLQTQATLERVNSLNCVCTVNAKKSVGIIKAVVAVKLENWNRCCCSS